jgi:hypothetical protein
LWANTNQAFLSAAAIDLNFIANDLHLPQHQPLDQYGASTWPPIGNVQEYNDYAKSKRNIDRTFGVFFVAHLFDNPYPPNSECPGMTFGITGFTGFDNDVTNDPAQRWSFIYLIDLTRLINECSKGTRPAGWSGFNVIVWALTHEMGHQRAGLVHPETNSLYHRGTYGAVPGAQPDVMSASPSIDVMGVHKFPAFDRLAQYPEENDRTTCQGNLARWRSIAN